MDGGFGNVTSLNFKYEHFPVVCPTCEGTGKRYPDIHNGMVTFVPVNDKRLRPAYTKLKICMLVLFLISVGVTTVYLIYPREINVRIQDVIVLNFTFETSNSSMLYQVNLSLNNTNFYPVTFHNVTIQLSYNQFVVAAATTQMYVGLRKQVVLPVILEAVYEGDAGKHIWNNCFKNQFMFGQGIQTSADLEYWIRSDHMSGENYYFYVDCSLLVFPLPTVDTLYTTRDEITTTSNTAS